MFFVSLKKLMVVSLFIVSAGTLFLGYSGWIGSLFNVYTGSEHIIEKINSQEASLDLSNTTTSQAKLPAASLKDKDNESFFVEYRLQRDRGRSQQVEMLKDILNTTTIDGDTKKAAQEQLLSISSSIAQESRLESLLKAYGYKNAVVCIEQKGASIVLEGSSRDIHESSELLEIISRETGIGEQDIIISNKE